MAEIVDVFDSNRFKAVTLSGHFSKKPYVPGRIGELGIFESDGMRTREMTISSRAGKVALIPATELGAPEPVHLGNKSKALKFTATHLPLRGTIVPAEIQDVLNLKTEGDQLMTAQDVIDEKMMEMATYHDATLEYQRLGALKGQLLDADGSTVLLDLFTAFGLSAPSGFSFALGTTTTEVQTKCQELYRLVRNALGGTPFRGIHCLVGDSFFDKLTSHPKVKEAYANYSTNSQLRTNYVPTGFDYCGIFFENYRGSVGGVDFVGDNEGIVIPLGVPGMYQTRFAPMNSTDWGNRKGLPRYASLERLAHGRGIDVLTESDPISICSYPEAIIPLTTN